MSFHPSNQPRSLLIASANPLFGMGLRKLVEEVWKLNIAVIGMTKSMEDTLEALNVLRPDLVIVEYDDQEINREDILNNFLASQRSMQVLLVSLQESGAVVVYDRRTLSPSQTEDWLRQSGLEDWTTESNDDEEK